MESTAGHSAKRTGIIKGGNIVADVPALCHVIKQMTHGLALVCCN